MAARATAEYDARWGYRHFDARRYERRRYGGFFRGMNFRLLARALGRALAGVRGIVLDVPCGTGILGDVFAARGLRVVGADISPAMLDVARDRNHGLGHVRTDLEMPPWRPRSFDAVVCARFLMHVPAADRPRVLRTLAGLSRGPLVATFCHPYTLKSFGRAVRRMLGRSPKRSPRVTRHELEAEVAAAGLRLDRVIPVLPLLSEVWVVVMRNPAAT
ncbi:MAG TPA: methyltransferase domain-containing protein [Candidatus Binatia bacterium]|nr:methyltransferase domain-containing protein [Candidatus Binatia bacterium]